MACKCSWANYSHKNWGDCQRSKNFRIAYCRSASNPKNDRSRQKELDRDLGLYERARKEGIQPETVSRNDVEYAMRSSDRWGEAYDAGGSIFQGDAIGV